MSEVSQSAPIHPSEEVSQDAGANPVQDVVTAAVAGADAASQTSVVAEVVADVAAVPVAEAIEPGVVEGVAEKVVAEVVPAKAEAVEAVADEVVAEVVPAKAAAVESVADEVVAEVAPAEAEAAVVPANDVSAVELDSEGKRVVRTLAVGQEVMGTVKRVSDFGAFVDIGVGRDGLVHISELSVKRVGKVTDVINEGQVVPMWIKKLDRERNRISLTMIPPGTKTLRDVSQGDIVNGTVTRILPYGAFVDIGVGRDALLHVREMGERFIAKPEEVVKVGETFEVRIIEVQRRRGRIDLSIKGLRPEPEVESTPPAQQGDYAVTGRSAAVAAPQVDAAPEPVDQFADKDMPSAMEVALRKAMDQSGVELKISRKKDKQRAESQRRQQEDIFARTLKQGK